MAFHFRFELDLPSSLPKLTAMLAEFRKFRTMSVLSTFGHNVVCNLFAFTLKSKHIAELSSDAAEGSILRSAKTVSSQALRIVFHRVISPFISILFPTTADFHQYLSVICQPAGIQKDSPTSDNYRTASMNCRRAASPMVLSSLLLSSVLTQIGKISGKPDID
jgi:hypothetical protein